MANQPKIDVTKDAVDVADGIAEDTKIILQNTGDYEVLLVEGATADAGEPNVLRGRRYNDAASYTVGTDPIWAFTSGSAKSKLALTY